MTFGVFEEIEKLIEYVPIESSNNEKSDAKFHAGVHIDSKFSFYDGDGVSTRLGVLEVIDGKTYVSFRDIIRLLNKFLKDATIEELKVKKSDSQKDHDHSTEAYLKCLLFDFCLATLDDDVFNAKLYLLHSIHFIWLRRRLLLLLSVIINESLFKANSDVRYFLVRLAVIAEPDNIDRYFDADNGGFHRRYVTYINEIQNLSTRGLSDQVSEKRDQSQIKHIS